MDQPLFDSADSALRFAFSYSKQQYSPTPMARLMRGTVGSGKGLVGNDGAAQAGMVRSEVEKLDALQLAILIAQFAPAHLPCDCGASCCSRKKLNPEWNAAVNFLTEHTVQLFAGSLSHYRLRRSLIERYFGARRDGNGKKLSVERLSEECGVHRHTAASHNERLTRYLRGTKGINGEVGIQARAMRVVDEILRGHGFVGIADAA
ncbi:DNA-binding protein [Cupriavidus pampae]|uniref:DNA-binding protein n=1 Tax=Cupriavidus pampae TaxID=659251 RepID=A0ABN7YW87_9BURK|nr:DNA-binding protein [Cupriavidus pampae]CAG9177710.1 hypothetical protein LMG32289_03881 [Cupriavidus pampae]